VRLAQAAAGALVALSIGIAVGCGGSGESTDTAAGDPQDVITFSRYDGRGAQVFTMAPDGSGVQAHSAISPDGTKIVYTQVNRTNSSVEVIDRSGGEPGDALVPGLHDDLPRRLVPYAMDRRLPTSAGRKKNRRRA
jgi:hypothetical protein